MDNGAYRQHSMIRPNEGIVEQKALKDTKLSNSIKELEKVNISTLNSEQKIYMMSLFGKKTK